MKPRQTYPETTEAFILEVERILSKYGMVYSGRGCACAGSPLIYKNSEYSLDLYPLRMAWRLKHGRLSLNQECYTGTERLEEFIQLALA